uniref:serine C-palmitoyltransferase n=1 Tax=Chlamydomonas euryale TaxID=1486919 RepID=A0A7R9V280_9CHLO|mmetsp:Transcript_13947/g.40433  ORF Transcript_13947/g.40433 Transcript_13947/m.40433 type:complete len:610 (+) Transcript_13947:244-2073(+)
MSSGRNEENIATPFVTGILSLLMLTWVYVMGKLRDLLPSVRVYTRKGYAPVRDNEEDFYMRRIYGRIQDCWNRPINNAPGAWVDVMERDNKFFQSGFPQARARGMNFTGSSKRCLNLGSYNYLGFAAADEYCTPRVQETLTRLGVVSACASRTDGGTTDVHVELEREVAQFLGKEDAIVVGMGYATNSAVIPVFAQKGTLIVSDQLNHASIVVGARGSGAKVKVFRHNDASHLDSVLRCAIVDGQPRSHRPWKKIIVIVEGVYSMEGETCNLRDIVAVCKKYRAYIYLDEAHSIGALGRTGRGCAEQWGVPTSDIDIMMGTFTKSFGSCGGYIAGSREMVGYLRRHCPAHLYATAISPGAAQQILSALKLINGIDGTTRGHDKICQLHDNANYFRMKLLEKGFHVLGDWDSPVMPIMMYHSGKLPAFSRMCLDKHLAVVIVGFPATSVLLVRTRVCISAAHSKEDLDFALEVIDHVGTQCLMKYRDEAGGREQVHSLLQSALHTNPDATLPYTSIKVADALKKGMDYVDKVLESSTDIKHAAVAVANDMINGKGMEPAGKAVEMNGKGKVLELNAHGMGGLNGNGVHHVNGNGMTRPMTRSAKKALKAF